MSSIEKYVDNIIDCSQLKKSEKQEYRAQFIDHIYALKSEYIEKGSSESEAEKAAIKDFGSTEQLTKMISNKFILKESIRNILLISFFAFFFVFVGHYIYLASGDSSSTRMGVLLPFRIITAIFKGIYRNGFNINDVDRIITYVVMFIPIGMILPLIFNQIRTFRNSLICYLVISIILLVIRFIFKLGTPHIDYAIMHISGCIIGYCIYKFLIRIHLVKVLVFKRI